MRSATDTQVSTDLRPTRGFSARPITTRLAGEDVDSGVVLPGTVRKDGGSSLGNVMHHLGATLPQRHTIRGTGKHRASEVTTLVAQAHEAHRAHERSSQTEAPCAKPRQETRRRTMMGDRDMRPDGNVPQIGPCGHDRSKERPRGRDHTGEITTGDGRGHAGEITTGEITTGETPRGTTWETMRATTRDPKRKTTKKRSRQGDHHNGNSDPQILRLLGRPLA